ncbi:glycine cleavage system T protein [Coniochaeta ligniaria NRRL 30616]|uniref:Aminomethyltransferase n=1 Tax=Coniochaeta ligniaria NRRL 30616 TaxID=1408157 RepID=A0A1J7K1C6_9PEZI|nr:glycine cleavage system T protein [Coniochaeta ligniaria NRRL 30616]
MRGLELNRSASRALRAASQAHRRSPVTLTPRSFATAALSQRHTPTPRSLAPQTRHASSSSPSAPLSKTPLHDLHLSHGAKLVPFGGFAMPVQYPSKSIRDSHIFTRTHASIFDVSHMVQRLFVGPGAPSFLQLLTPSDLTSLPPHKSTLSTLLSPSGSGGIVDDTVITRLPDRGASNIPVFYVVTNAGCREKDDAYFASELSKWSGPEVKQEQLTSHALIALQGPDSARILESALSPHHPKPDLSQLYFGSSLYARLSAAREPVLVSRGGYTGEDGFEISIPDSPVAVTEALLKLGGEDIDLAGLGARDSLRLEAGMCLYGHDLDETTTPVEAGLSWIIPKSRRGADAGYYGAEVIAAQLVPKTKGGKGVERRRVGLVVEGAPAREGAEILGGENGEKVGVVTSGCPSPTLGKNIAMGYVADGFHKAGTEVDVLVRGKKRRAVVSKMPFVPSRYHKGAA